MRPSIEEIMALFQKDVPSTEDLCRAIEPRKESVSVVIPHERPSSITDGDIPPHPVLTLGRLQQKQRRLELQLQQQDARIETVQFRKIENAVELYLEQCAAEAKYARHKFGSLWRAAMIECGAVVADWRKISSEDVCEAVLSVRQTMLPPLNSWQRLMDEKDRANKGVHRLRVRKYSMLLGDYLNNQHHFDRERQKRAEDHRALLRRIRLLVVVNPLNDERLNTSQALHPANMDLLRTTVAVTRLNKTKIFGKHTDRPICREYLDELVPEFQLTVTKGQYYAPPLPTALAPVAEPWKRSHFTRFLGSLL